MRLARNMELGHPKAKAFCAMEPNVNLERTHLPLRWFWAFLSLALLAACGSDDYYCDDTGCYYCDGIGCRRVEAPQRPPCQSHAECAQGTVCTELGCVEVCGGDAQCRTKGTVCRSADGLCLEPSEETPDLTPTACMRSADCNNPNLWCKDGACVLAPRCGSGSCDCSATGQCEDPNYNCIEGQCRAKSVSCRFADDCGDISKRACLNGACLPLCSAANPNCPSGYQCDTQLNVCRPAPGNSCQQASDCGAGNRACIDGRCYEACSGDPDCGAGRYCDQGLCRNDDRQLNTCEGCQHLCVEGQCRTPCGQGYFDCAMVDPNLSQCLPAAPLPYGLCVSPRNVGSNCSLPRDCAAGQLCLNGICR